MRRRGEGSSAAGAWWQSVVPAASSFNNAGFSVFPAEHLSGASITAFADDFVVLPIMGALILVGGLGYLVIYEFVTVRRISRFSMDTKLILVGTVALLMAGAALVFAVEFNREGALAGRTTGQKAADAIFQSVSGRTAGFTRLIGVRRLMRQTWACKL